MFAHRFPWQKRTFYPPSIGFMRLSWIFVALLWYYVSGVEFYQTVGGVTKGKKNNSTIGNYVFHLKPTFFKLNVRRALKSFT